MEQDDQTDFAYQEDVRDWNCYNDLYRHFVNGRLNETKTKEMLALGIKLKTKLGKIIKDEKGNIEFATTKTGSIKLAVPKRLGYQVHHLIPVTPFETHSIWKMAGMSIHDSDNLLHLPMKAAAHLISGGTAVHEGRHSREISENIKTRFEFIISEGRLKNWDDVSPAKYKEALLKIISNQRKICLSEPLYLNKNHEKEAIQYRKLKSSETLLSFVVGVSLGLGSLTGSGLNTNYTSAMPHPLLDQGIHTMVYGRRRRSLDGLTPKVPFKAAFMRHDPNSPHYREPRYTFDASHQLRFPSPLLPKHKIGNPNPSLLPTPKYRKPIKPEDRRPTPQQIPKASTRNVPVVRPISQNTPRLIPASMLTPSPREPKQVQQNSPIPSRPSTPIPSLPSTPFHQSVPKFNQKPINPETPLIPSTQTSQKLFTPSYQAQINRYKPIIATPTKVNPGIALLDKQGSLTSRSEPSKLNSTTIGRPQSSPTRTHSKAFLYQNSNKPEAMARHRTHREIMQQRNQQIRDQKEEQARLAAQQAQALREKARQEQLRKSQEQARQAAALRREQYKKQQKEQRPTQNQQQQQLQARQQQERARDAQRQQQLLYQRQERERQERARLQAQQAQQEQTRKAQQQYIQQQNQARLRQQADQARKSAAAEQQRRLAQRQRAVQVFHQRRRAAATGKR